jgi:hypothetical protein
MKGDSSTLATARKRNEVLRALSRRRLDKNTDTDFRLRPYLNAVTFCWALVALCGTAIVWSAFIYGQWLLPPVPAIIAAPSGQRQASPRVLETAAEARTAVLRGGPLEPLDPPPRRPR